jgi:integrase/recombinase XerD
MASNWVFPYEVPDGISVYKPAGSTERVKWHVAYKPAPGARREVKRISADPKTTYRKILKIKDAMELGEIDPRAARFAMQEAIHVHEHLEDYAKYLKAQGDTAKQVRQVKTRAKWIVDEASIQRLSELRPSTVAAAIAVLRERGASGESKKGCSLATCNYYIRAIKQFSAWLCNVDKRAPYDELKILKGYNVRTDRRHDRQDLGDEGGARLIAAAEAGGYVFDMSGHDRAMLIETALETGFRAGELASLTPRSFVDLDGDHPKIVVQASFSKHRREDHQPIRQEFAAKLRTWLEGRPVNAKLWKLPPEPIELIKKDLKRARKTWLEEAGENPEELKKREESDFLLYEDHDGRFADFHALRHTYIMRLVRGGLAPKECQLLARHASISQTMDYYAHMKIQDTARALVKMTALPATKTAAPKRPNRRQAQRDAQRILPIASRELSLCVVVVLAGSSVEVPLAQYKKPGQPGLGETHPAGLEPATYGSVGRTVVSSHAPPETEVIEASQTTNSAMRSAHADEHSRGLPENVRDDENSSDNGLAELQDDPRAKPDTHRIDLPYFDRARIALHRIDMEISQMHGWGGAR